MKEHGVYIHLPFCKSRCAYCDFFSTATNEIPFDAYRTALVSEWKRRRVATTSYLGKRRSLYIGGGTPSLWPAKALTDLLGELSVREDEEVTVEVNPKDADRRWFQALRDAGVNRFSIGVQALDDERLRFLGRRHNAEDARRAVKSALLSGAKSVSADLIFGAAGHGVEAWKREIEALVDLGVHHISAYELTLSKGTPLFAKSCSGERVTADEDTLAKLYRAARGTLKRLGLPQYEVSNYAPSKHRSRHNLNYWKGGEYLGLGAGAHGFVLALEKSTRYCNTEDTASYIRAALESDAPLATGIDPGGFTEHLSDLDRAREKIMLGLRTISGAPFEEILHTLPLEQRDLWQKEARKLISQKPALLRLRKGRLVPTARGLISADGIAQRFF